MSRATQPGGIIWFAFSAVGFVSPHGVLPSFISSGYLFTRRFTVRTSAEVYSYWCLGDCHGSR